MAEKKYLSYSGLSEYDALLKQHIDESISNVDFIINANASTQIDTGMYMVTLDHTIAEVNAAYEADKKMLLIFKNSDGNYINLNFFAYLNGLYMFTGASASGIMTAYVNESTSFVQESSVQDKIVGTSGQIVGFDGSGNAVAQDMPVIPIDKGGTNATTAEAARTNLNVYSKAEIDEVLAPITEPLVVTVTIGNSVEGSNFVFDATPDKPLADVVSALDNGRPVYITDSYGLKYKVINWTDTAYIIESTSVNQYGEIVSTSMQIGDGVGYYMYSSALGKEELQGIVTELETAIAAKASSDYVEGMEDTLQAAIDGKVPVTRKVNNKELSVDISLTAADVGADPVNSASNALTSAQTYTDEKIALLLNNSTEAVDSIYELRDAMEENTDAISALNNIAAGKANAEHDHEIADVTGLQDALNGKAASEHGTHVTYSADAPKIDGTASAGSSPAVARADHVHPTDTTRASKTEFDTHVADAVKHITAAERTAWNATEQNVKTYVDGIAANKSDKNHTHDAATSSANGFMTAAMVQKLEGIQVGATNVVVDATLSTSSTNPVQNKVISSSLSTLTETISLNTQSINSHNQSISNLQTAIDQIQEITSSEISALFAN